MTEKKRKESRFVLSETQKAFVGEAKVVTIHPVREQEPVDHPAADPALSEDQKPAEALGAPESKQGTEGHVEVKQTQPEASAQASEDLKVKPWEDLTGLTPKNHLLVLDPALWAKLNWLCNNMPGRQSQQKLVRSGVEKFVAELLEQHYKP